MRLMLNLVAAALIAGTAFLAAGLAYGDPRVVALFGLDRPQGPVVGPDGVPDAGTPVPGHTALAPAPQEAPAEASGLDTPPPGLEEQDQPLGQPKKPAVASTAYRFLATNSDGSPVGYSPCRPLHYVVNSDLAPQGAERLVDDSIAVISRATGIVFIFDGPTAEAPSPSRPPYQKDAYGDRWAPLLIAWTTPEQAPRLQGSVVGTGGSTHFSFGGGPRSFVTGSLELDAPQIARDIDRADGAAYATAVILHELGHVMGLDHVQDPAQLMYGEIGTPDGFAAGDLNGLYELGQARCRKDL
ncbi:peptidase M10A and M12B matrixin and adamalysin [Arthrobacter oryzae]|uniref:Peptidase M10A and M12B matrixin and adamalysin n=1 Tax=Arthrobacter oryzae TaxID=409290 RepID=A0A3N0C443_9MICC|nr:peptidase M10A and M12B matrixin and adamalysin [Arthrobacter oryzae]